MDKPSYYAVIPATVRYDPELKGDEKVLYGEITALSSKEGYCWASNEHFANLFSVHKKTISEWINHLRDRHHVETEVDKLGNRKIYIVKPPSTKTGRGIHQTAEPPPPPNGGP